MAERRLTHTGKDDEGEITHLCNPEAGWSPRSKSDAIRGIEGGQSTYFVQTAEGRSDIELVDGPTGKYLRTVRGGKAGNNLDNLPDC